MKIETHDIWRINNIDVFCSKETIGGGHIFGLECLDIINKKYAKTFNNAFEWCAGAGFLGYGLLATGLAKNISFNEIYKPAVDLLEQTKKENNIKDRCQICQIYHTHEIDNIHMMFDLVVGNPPHFKNKEDALEELRWKQMGWEIKGHFTEILVDYNWKAHKNFFSNIKSKLAGDGVILLQENKRGSTYKDFEEIIKQARLKITDVFDSPHHGHEMEIYYMEVTHD